MPFVAIAAIIALCVGGGVTVAADQAKPGDALYQYKVHVNDTVRHEYNAIRASLTGEAEVDADVNAAGGTRLSGTPEDDQFEEDLSGQAEVDLGLRIRHDADAEAKAIDDRINADGSLEVRAF